MLLDKGGSWERQLLKNHAFEKKKTLKRRLLKIESSWKTEAVGRGKILKHERLRKKKALEKEACE